MKSTESRRYFKKRDFAIIGIPLVFLCVLLCDALLFGHFRLFHIEADEVAELTIVRNNNWSEYRIFVSSPDDIRTVSDAFNKLLVMEPALSESYTIMGGAVYTFTFVFRDGTELPVRINDGRLVTLISPDGNNTKEENYICDPDDAAAFRLFFYKFGYPLEKIWDVEIDGPRNTQES